MSEDLRIPKPDEWQEIVTPNLLDLMDFLYEECRQEGHMPEEFLVPAAIFSQEELKDFWYNKLKGTPYYRGVKVCALINGNLLILQTKENFEAQLPIYRKIVKSEE